MANMESPPASGNMYEPQWIIRGYNPYTTYSQKYIKEENVVQPSNHRYSTMTDHTSIQLSKSMAGCQIYGTCEKCYSSGPVCKVCYVCGGACIYHVIYYKERIIDSITLALKLERGYEPAMADRTFNWDNDPVKNETIEWLEYAVIKDRELSDEKRCKILRQVMYMLDLQANDGL